MGKKKKKKAKGGNRKSEAEIDRLLCFWREEEALQDEVGSQVTVQVKEKRMRRKEKNSRK